MNTLVSAPPRWWLVSLLAAAAAFVVAFRFLGPANLLEHNEQRMACYTLDVVRNGQWVVQHHADGALATKPPLFTWVSSLVALAAGGVNRFTLYFPSAFALVVLGPLLLVGGERPFGRWAAAWASLAMVFSFITIEECLSTRYDLFFTVPVVLGAWAAFRAWETGRGWTWFWLAGIAATLTKGPLGVLLAGCGLLAAVWEWRTGQGGRVRGSHALGVFLYFAVCLTWLGLAYRQEGQVLLQTLFIRELLQHAVGRETESLGFYKPLLVLLGGFAPWGWLAVRGAWRAWRTPAVDPTERRWERFLTCWLVFGLLLFTAAAHGRSRLMLPVLPAAAWLAGREVMWWLNARNWPVRRTFGLVMAVGLAAAAAIGFGLPGQPKNVEATQFYRELGRLVKTSGGREFPLTYQAGTTLMQLEMGTMWRAADNQLIVELLRGSTPVFVVAKDRAALGELNGVNVQELYRAIGKGGQQLWLLSNHPQLEATDPVVMAVGFWKLELGGYRIDRQRGDELTFVPLTAPRHVIVTNMGPEPRHLTLRVKTPDGSTRVINQIVAPGESSRWEAQTRHSVGGS